MLPGGEGENGGLLGHALPQSHQAGLSQPVPRVSTSEAGGQAGPGALEKSGSLMLGELRTRARTRVGLSPMSFACEPITEEGLPLSYQSPGTTECHETSIDLRDEVHVDERELGGGRGPPRTVSGKSSE